MTVPPDSAESHTHAVGEIEERLEEYLDVLKDERETVESILSDLEEAPEDQALTRDEYRHVFPATMPIEEWGGFRG